MFREMRRSKQLLSVDDTVAIINRCTNGVLACFGKTIIFRIGEQNYRVKNIANRRRIKKTSAREVFL